MRRRLLNLLTGLSLLNVAAAVLWLRSLSVTDGLARRGPGGALLWLISCNGTAELAVVRDWPVPSTSAAVSGSSELKRALSRSGNEKSFAPSRARRIPSAIPPGKSVEVGDRRIDPTEFIAWCRTCGIEAPAAISEVESDVGIAPKVARRKRPD